MGASVAGSQTPSSDFFLKIRPLLKSVRLPGNWYQLKIPIYSVLCMDFFPSDNRWSRCVQIFLWTVSRPRESSHYLRDNIHNNLMFNESRTESCKPRRPGAVQLRAPSFFSKRNQNHHQLYASSGMQDLSFLHDESYLESARNLSARSLGKLLQQQNSSKRFCLCSL